MPTLCTGAPSTLRFTARGGTAPYVWTLHEAPPGLELTTNLGPQAVVSGLPLEADDYALHIEVRDAEGTVVAESFEHTVHRTPEVLTRHLPVTCRGQAYSHTLEASGGDADSYIWSMTLPPEQGLTITDGVLAGHFEPPRNTPGGVEFELRVDDGYCESEAVEVRLGLENGGTRSCPEIRTTRTVPDTLPAACRHSHYSAQFILNGGSGEYQWKVLAVPRGLTFNDTNPGVSGTPTAAGPLTLEIVDSAGRATRRTFDIQPRDSCWFAYISNETGPKRLHLVDPVLHRYFDTRQTFPADASAGDVLDFKFSQDGKLLAYRVQGESGPLLSVLRAPDWVELPLDFGASVTEYAWSATEATLAVALTNGDGSFLAGADFSSATTLLTPTPVLGVSKLVWFSDTDVAFYSPGDFDPFLDLNYASRSQSGFSSPTANLGSAFTEFVRLQPAPRGLFASDPISENIRFFPILDGGAAVFHYNVLVAPSGAYAGRVTGDSLHVFSPMEPSLEDGAQAALRADHCNHLIGWAEGRERIACTTDHSGTNRIVVVDVQESALSLPKEVRGDYRLPRGAHAQRRRVFSRTGNTFAFVTEEALYYVNLEAPGTPIAVGITEATMVEPSPDSEMGVSHDDRWLLRHNGKRLSLYSLFAGGPIFQELNDELRPAAQCVESFISMDAPWCGTQQPALQFGWAPADDVAFFRKSTGKLTFFDAESFAFTALNDNCGEGCIQDPWIGFQP